MPRRRLPPRPWGIVEKKVLTTGEVVLVDAEGATISVLERTVATYIMETVNCNWAENTDPIRHTFSNDPRLVRKMGYRPTHRGKQICK